MSAHSFGCQQAVFAALTAGNAIAEGRVYDHARQDVDFPYVEIGEGQIIPDDTTSETVAAGDAGVSEFIDIHAWDRPSATAGHRGFKRVKEISDQIHDALHGRSLAIPGRTSAFAWIRTVRFMTDADALTRHGVISLEVIHRT